ncbi:MAG TPA: hypothetical protein VGO43_10290 [Pyrinomonadaceae bacterium]|jgi:hypothetical protein|nr:hypothetical protein [Pyrinomonadaceae bacterium]
MTKLLCKLTFVALLGVLTASTALGQTEKLGNVKYTAPAGMSKMPKDNVVAFSQFDQATGKFCIITLYGATPGTGNAKGDFAREWDNLVVKTFTTAEASPKTETSSEDGWTAIGGGSEVEGGVGKAVAFLTVISGYGQTVSILGVFNDQSLAGKVDSFMSGVVMDKVTPPTSTATTGAGQPQTGSRSLCKHIVPILQRQLTLADLAGDWGDSDRISTAYVYSSDGAYAGTDSLAFKSKWTIKANGGYIMDFFEIRNGKKSSDLETGSISIAGRVITKKPKEYGTTRHVVIGWLDLPDKTLMSVSGTYFAGNEIPTSVLSTNDDCSYTTIWVRKK